MVSFHLLESAEAHERQQNSGHLYTLFFTAYIYVPSLIVYTDYLLNNTEFTSLVRVRYLYSNIMKID